jgi:hypothetical protein
VTHTNVRAATMDRVMGSEQRSGLDSEDGNRREVCIRRWWMESRQPAMLGLQQGLQKLFGLRLLQRSSAASEPKRLLVAERLSGDS